MQEPQLKLLVFAIAIAVIVLVVVDAAAIWLLGMERAQAVASVSAIANTLFAGLAFAGLVYAILLQRAELALQRKELEQTRHELEGQKLQLVAQNRTLENQHGTAILFNSLTLHESVVGSLRFSPNGDAHWTVHGRAVFLPLSQKLEETVRPGPAGALDSANARGALERRFNDLLAMPESDVEQYFTSLTITVRAIHGLPANLRTVGMEHLVARMSQRELLLVLLFGLTPAGEQLRIAVCQAGLLWSLRDTPQTTGLRAAFGVDAFKHPASAS